MANLNNGGLTRVLNYLKTWVTNLLSSKSDTSHSHTWNDIVSKPSFANVATSGSYNDLSNKPTIPTVNNATLTIQKNSSNVATFTANASSNVTANISVPTKVSELTNDSGFITSSGSCNYANSAGAVAWDNVSGKPSTFTPYFANGTWYAVGDDAAIGDHNVGGGLGVKALNSTTTRIDFCYKDDASNYKSITYDGTTLYMNGNCDYATNSGYTNWLRTSSHTDHLFHTEWDGSYFWTYVTAGDGGYRPVRVERSNSSGWADSAGGVAWGNVSGRPTVNNATLTIQKNGTTVNTFTANASSDVTCNITVPTKVSELTNDSGCIIVEEQGDGYIRYSNGIQICWKYNLITRASSGTWTYPKTFISIPCIWWQANGNNTVYVDAVNSGDVSTSNAIFIPSRYMNGSVVTAPYGVDALAIGRWK